MGIGREEGRAVGPLTLSGPTTAQDARARIIILLAMADMSHAPRRKKPMGDRVQLSTTYTAMHLNFLL